MPLPLGHFAIGFTTYRLFEKSKSEYQLWKIAVFSAILANLPDMDVIIGLIAHGNGCIYHRGPTHSILFALITGLLASNLYRLWSQVPKLNFGICFLIILTHLFADLVFTVTPVPLFWPLEIYWAVGHKGWIDVVSIVFFDAFQDMGIILGCTVVLIIRSGIAKRFRSHGRGGGANRPWSMVRRQW